jgi:tetratricopeptide (TPR) repeat protein
MDALNIRVDVLGYIHLDVAYSFSNIGKVYDKYEMYEKSVEYYETALEIREVILNNEYADEESIILLQKIGDDYYELSDFDHALEFYKKMQTAYQKSEGETNLKAARIYKRIGNAYYGLDKNEDAIEYYLKAYDIRKTILGDSNINVATVCKDIADCYWEMDSHKKAAKYYREAYSLYEKIENLDDKDKTNMGICAERMKQD